MKNGKVTQLVVNAPVSVVDERLGGWAGPRWWKHESPLMFVSRRVMPAAPFRARRPLGRPVRKVVLPDYLSGNPYSDLNQPVWCSYAMGARTAMIVSTEGRVFFQQEWLQTDYLAEAIDLYWASV